jgi:3-hydroxyacyl-CoA dehydrogenase
VVNIDRAMRWGFNWDSGPFEVRDAIGVKSSVERMKVDGLDVPGWVTEMLASGRDSFYSGARSAPQFFNVKAKSSQPVPIDPRVLKLAAVKSDAARVVKKNLGASLVDICDGVLCFETHTKMNTLDGDVIQMIDHAIEAAEKDFRAIVVGNDGEHFGAGANIFMILMAAQQKKWDQVEQIISSLQNAFQRLRFSKVPVVSAPFQYTLGGGCEFSMASDATQAHAETYVGLVEVGVGLVPAGGGCLRLVERFTGDLGAVDADPLPFIGQASLNIAMAKVATSAFEAKELRYLRPGDGITLNREYLLYHAKARAIGLAEAGYRPPRPQVFKAAGLDVARTIGAKIWGMVEGRFASEHDALIANKVAHILCGGVVAEGTELTEQAYLDLEREAFMSLCGEAKSVERIAHMLQHGKPLRN